MFANHKKSTNIAFLLASLVATNASESHLYSIHLFRIIHILHEIFLLGPSISDFGPVSLYKSLEQIWAGQMHWVVYRLRATPQSRTMEDGCAMCGNQFESQIKPLNKMLEMNKSPSEIYIYGIVALWQAVLQNYTYNWKCENGKLRRSEDRDSRLTRMA